MIEDIKLTLIYFTFNLQRWSAYGEERYTPLTADAKITGVYLREVVAVLPDDVCHGYLINRYLFILTLFNIY